MVDRHTPLKQKTVRGNNAPFMTKQLNKAIMDRSIIKNGYSKWPSRENILELKKAKRKNLTKKLCKNLTKKSKKQYFRSVSSKDMAANKQFWDIVKPFFSNKNLHSDYHISINDKYNKIVDNELKLVELFDTHFVNTAENTTGKTPGIPLVSKKTPIMLRKSIQNIKII